MPLYPVFWPLYMLRVCCPMRGDVEYCWEEPWNASEDEGRECNMVMVLEDCIGGGSTSAMGSAVVRAVPRYAMAASNGSAKAWRMGWSSDYKYALGGRRVSWPAAVSMGGAMGFDAIGELWMGRGRCRAPQRVWNGGCRRWRAGGDDGCPYRGRRAGVQARQGESRYVYNTRGGSRRVDEVKVEEERAGRAVERTFAVAAREEREAATLQTKRVTPERQSDVGLKETSRQ